MKHLVKNKYWHIYTLYNIDKLLYLLIDRPDKINIDILIWMNNKKQYCRHYDLPALVSVSGDCFWYKNNELHREKGKPIRIHFNGNKYY